jgi:hypothetical protein
MNDTKKVQEKFEIDPVEIRRQISGISEKINKAD